MGSTGSSASPRRPPMRQLSTSVPSPVQFCSLPTAVASVQPCRFAPKHCTLVLDLPPNHRLHLLDREVVDPATRLKRSEHPRFATEAPSCRPLLYYDDAI